MAAAIVSEVLPEDRRSYKKHQRRRVVVKSLPQTPATLWASQATVIRTRFIAGDLAGLETYVKSIKPWMYEFPNVSAAVVEFGNAAIDILSGDTGAEQASTGVCIHCRQTPVNLDETTVCDGCSVEFWNAIIGLNSRN